MSSKLQHLVVADPIRETAQTIADACERLAEVRDITLTGDDTLNLVAEKQPQLLIVSLELTRPEIVELMPRLQRVAGEVLIIATYRELSVPLMEKLSRFGLTHFVPQPVEVTEIFRAASNRFQMHFRRHDRHNVTVEVFRADGVLVGRTRDLSEGGMSMDALHPVHPDESQLFDLALPDNASRSLRVRCRILQVEGTSPAPVLARVQFERLWGPEHKRLVDYMQARVDKRA